MAVFMFAAFLLLGTSVLLGHVAEEYTGAEDTGRGFPLANIQEGEVL